MPTILSSTTPQKCPALKEKEKEEGAVRQILSVGGSLVLVKCDSRGFKGWVQVIRDYRGINLEEKLKIETREGANCVHLPSAWPPANDYVAWKAIEPLIACQGK